MAIISAIQPCVKLPREWAIVSPKSNLTTRSLCRATFIITERYRCQLEQEDSDMDTENQISGTVETDKLFDSTFNLDIFCFGADVCCLALLHD